MSNLRSYSYRLRQSLWQAWARLPGASQRRFVEPYTMLSRDRLMALERSIYTVIRRGVAGQIVECGTAQGGSAALLALWLRRLQSPKQVFIFDTFEGLPSPTYDDPDYDKAVVWTGKCRGELGEVQALFRNLGVFERAVFVKGKFQDTLPAFNIPPIALLHLDSDWYESTKTCLRHLWDHVSPGGIIHFDDYGDWKGCRKAVDEFFESRGITDQIHFIDYGACWLMKSRC